MENSIPQGNYLWTVCINEFCVEISFCSPLCRYSWIEKTLQYVWSGAFRPVFSLGRIAVPCCLLRVTVTWLPYVFRFTLCIFAHSFTLSVLFPLHSLKTSHSHVLYNSVGATVCACTRVPCVVALWLCWLSKNMGVLKTASWANDAPCVSEGKG